MAALGTVNPLDLEGPITLVPIEDYQINRGLVLGELAVLDLGGPIELSAPNNYIVRMLSVVYRQLWPSHGQRFPQ
jgi:hypothetical protein